MSFEASAGRIYCTSSDGRTVFDTDEGLFHVVGAGISGTQSIANFSQTGNIGKNRQDNLTAIGTCDPACTHVVGSVKFGGSGTWAVAFSRWTTYLGGDLVWAMTAPGTTSSTAGDILEAPNLFCFYNFYCSAGTVYMRQRRQLPAVGTGVTVGISAHTITYKLKTGLFT